MKKDEALKKMYQLLLTEPHAPTVCAQLEEIAREALAQPEQEPLGYIASMALNDLRCGIYLDVSVYGEEYEETVPIYTTPPQRKPLTDEQIAEMMMQTWGCASIAPRHAPDFARAIEAAHGIGDKT